MITLKSIFSLLINCSKQEISLCDSMGFDLIRDYSTYGRKNDLINAVNDLGNIEILNIGSYSKKPNIDGLYICLDLDC